MINVRLNLETATGCDAKNWPVAVGEIDTGEGNAAFECRSAPAGGDFGFISVFENHIGHDAICSGNSPAVTRNTQGQLDFLGRSVGPNEVKHDDSCD